jgi:hypothetical protein
MLLVWRNNLSRTGSPPRETRSGRAAPADTSGGWSIASTICGRCFGLDVTNHQSRRAADLGVHVNAIPGVSRGARSVDLGGRLLVHDRAYESF